MLVFLFTDLEASTRLWEQHPEEMGQALARHDDILRDAVVSNEGSVVKTTGDGLMATFATVPRCIDACMDAQRALATAAWDIPEPLRVRMGVHAGDAEPRDGDYYGPAVNRAARIMAAGHGGQVLLSTLAAELTGHTPGVELRDLGPHRLKDLKEPEHLFQLVAAGLPAEFPPLATLEATPHNLPVQVSEFFGRDTEMAAVRSMLERPRIRLVTLTGPGGAGKTRLALQVAAEVAGRYRDGVFFVDLSAERVPDAAFEAVLRDVGLSSAKEGSPLQVLKTKLRDSEMLLILDNFEQVTEAGPGVAELLQVCPGLEVVLTSREALHVRGEQVFPVPALALPDPQAPTADIAASEAALLFVERARSAQPDFTLTDTNAPAVAEITARLDGLPLAIELAAARLGVFSVGELRDRLRTRIDVLGRGARDLPDRQRTLWSTIAWSYELLDPDECLLFQLMSVFSTARLDAVEGVAAQVFPDVDVIDVLASLVAKSLVRSAESEGTRRFSMLATIREYAAERLAEAPETEAEVRLVHARFVAGYASELGPALDGSGREEALEELSSEIGNLRTAWRYWVEAGDLDQLHRLLDSLWALTDSRGWYHAAVELTSDLLAVLSNSEPSPERDVEEMTLRTSLARSLMAVRGFTGEVEDQFRRALELSSPTDGAARRAPVLRALASYYLNIGDMAASTAMGRELLELGEQERNTGVTVEGHVVLGSTISFMGSMAEGLDHLDRAIALYDPAKHGAGRFRLGPSPGVVARIASGLLLMQEGRPTLAVERAADALRFARALGHPFSLAYVLYHAGFLDFGRGRFEPARQAAEELTSLADKHDYPVWRALGAVLHGVAECGLGRAEEGLARAETGAEVYQGLTTPPVFWPPLLALRAAGFAIAGRPRRALELIEEAIGLTPHEIGFPDFHILRGDIMGMFPDGDPTEIQGSYRAAIRGSRTMKARMVELAATCRLLEFPGERTPEEIEGLRVLYESFTEGFDEPELVAARAILGMD